MDSPVSGVGVAMSHRSWYRVYVQNKYYIIIDAVEVSELRMKIQQYSKNGQLWKSLQKCDHN